MKWRRDVRVADDKADRARVYPGRPKQELGCPVDTGRRIGTMSVEELESEALKLDPKSRARLAGKLLVRLDELTEQESAQLWAAEAQRRDAQMDSDPGSGRPAEDVFREAWSRIE